MVLLDGKSIILGVGGGISAYKSLELIRLLRKGCAEVSVMPTSNALHFVGKLSFESLSQRPCLTEPLSVIDGKISHVEEAYRASAIVVAPATCDLIAKLANGISDSLILQTILSFRGPVLIVPAMETHMWEHPATQKNILILKEYGYLIVGPQSGGLASGRNGIGRMSEPETILEHIRSALAKKDFEGRKVLVTAGPTVEDIDPVRFLSNRSSGKMGVALARAFAERGAEVYLVHGPLSVKTPSLASIVSYPVRSAFEMHDKVHELLPGCHIAIMCAAVADFSPLRTASEKIKKSEANLKIDLKRTPDILSTVGALKERPFLVGFAAETENIEKEALRKLHDKNCDLICANLILSTEGVFEKESNHVLVFDKNNKKTELMRAPKDQIAHQILDIVLASQKV